MKKKDPIRELLDYWDTHDEYDDLLADLEEETLEEYLAKQPKRRPKK